jgi:hypothetical protein
MQIAKGTLLDECEDRDFQSGGFAIFSVCHGFGRAFERAAETSADYEGQHLTVWEFSDAGILNVQLWIEEDGALLTEDWVVSKALDRVFQVLRM